MQIHFVGQGDDLLGASDNAQLTSLTPLGIDHDGAFQFCHILSFNILTSYKIGCKGTDFSLNDKTIPCFFPFRLLWKSKQLPYTGFLMASHKLIYSVNMRSIEDITFYNTINDPLNTADVLFTLLLSDS